MLTRTFSGSVIRLQLPLLFLLALLPMKECRAQPVDTARFTLDLGLTGNVQTGNFERLQFINQLRLSLHSRDRRWNFLSRHLYLYQRVFGNETQNDYLTHTFATRYLSPRLDVFGAIFLEKHLIKRIDLHTQFGAGVRYALVKSPRAFMQLGLMGSYSNKRYLGANFADFDNGGDPTIEAFFLSPVLNTRFVLAPRRVYFNLLCLYQQDVTVSQNWRFNLESALSMPVHGGLSLKISFNNFYENINLVGVRANDTFLTYGLNLRIAAHDRP